MISYHHDQGTVYKQIVDQYRMQKRSFSRNRMDQVCFISNGRIGNWLVNAVPVVVVVTKFDTLVMQCEQEIVESGTMKLGDEDLTRTAMERAEQRFEEYYEKPLMAMAHPPDAIVRTFKGN